MKSAYDDDDLIEAVVKIIKRLNIICPIIRNPDGVSTGIPMLRKNTPHNAGNFDASSRNRFNTMNNSESYMKNKRIQCNEYEGFRHIRVECVNTLTTKNNFFNATRSDCDSDYSEDHESKFVVFGSRTENTSAVET